MLILSAAFFPAKSWGFTVYILSIKEELVSSLNASGSTWDWSKAEGTCVFSIVMFNGGRQLATDMFGCN